MATTPNTIGSGCGAEDGRGVEAGGVFSVAVVAAAVEDDGGDAGLSDEVEDVIVAGGEGMTRKGQATT